MPEISYVLFLFAVNGDDGDSSIQEHICLPVDEFELCIPVRMLFPKLHGFLVQLSAVPQLFMISRFQNWGKSHLTEYIR